MNTDLNKMMCDPVTGICEVPGENTSESQLVIKSKTKPVKLIYFTDPICSSCWGIEPQLRKLKLEYEEYLDIEYRMGGLLKGWDSYQGRDVGNANDVAIHWDEASEYYEMPIDGDVWLEDPLHSSYPPSIAFKAAQLQDEQKALKYLRRIKEMVFLEKKNITKWEHIKEAALQSGLNPEILKTDIVGKGKELFEKDLELARKMGVRGFPTIFFMDEEGSSLLVYGSKPYEAYEQTLLKLHPEAQKKVSSLSPELLFEQFETMTNKEFSVLSGKDSDQAETILNELEENKVINKFQSKNGPLWVKQKS